MKCEAIRGFWLKEEPVYAGVQIEVPDHLVLQLEQAGKIRRLPAGKSVEKAKADKHAPMTAANAPALVPGAKHEGDKNA